MGTKRASSGIEPLCDIKMGTDSSHKQQHHQQGVGSAPCAFLAAALSLSSLNMWKVQKRICFWRKMKSYIFTADCKQRAKLVIFYWELQFFL